MEQKLKRAFHKYLRLFQVAEKLCQSMSHLEFYKIKRDFWSKYKNYRVDPFFFHYQSTQRRKEAYFGGCFGNLAILIGAHRERKIQHLQTSVTGE